MEEDKSVDEGQWQQLLVRSGNLCEEVGGHLIMRKGAWEAFSIAGVHAFRWSSQL